MRHLFSAFMAMSLLMVLSACGKATAPAPKGLLGEIKQRGLIRVAVTGTSPPFSYVNEKNELTGFDVQLAKDLAKGVGVKIEFVQTPFANLVPGIQANKFDVVIAGTTITEKRKEVVDFAEPYQVNGVAVFVNKDNKTITDPKVLKGKRIGVALGSSHEEKLKKQEGVNVKTYNSTEEAFRDLGAKRIDGVVAGIYFGLYTAKKLGLPVEPAGDLLEFEVNAFMLRKNEPDFKKALDDYVAAVIKDGRYKKYSIEYVGADISQYLSLKDKK